MLYNEDEEEFVEHRYTQLKKFSGETFFLYAVSLMKDHVSETFEKKKVSPENFLSCVYLCSTNSSSS